MTDLPERVSVLETNMSTVLSILSKREDYQNSVLVKLTTIELKQDQALLYQKTCDAERAAHGTRIGMLENTATSLAKTVESVEGLAGRLANVERRIARDSTVWWTVLKIAGLIGAVITVGAAGAELWHWLHP